MKYNKNKLLKFDLNPPRALVLGFLALIIIGGVLLSIPGATANGNKTTLLDALFTSASASCVTGLIVVNTAEHWSLFGQGIILLLIQIGGLGIMTMATIISLIAGKKISLSERLIIKEQMNQEALSGLVKLIRYVIFLTFTIEALGAVFLSFTFIPKYGVGKGIWFSIFHSISAFCNAGFDITGDSFMSFTGSYLTIFTLSALIIVGGIGFAVVLDIAKNKKWTRLGLHTKLVLTISGTLLVLGSISFFILEYSNPDTLGSMSFIDKMFAAVFASVVPRTAGFNSIDVSLMRESSAFLTIILMFIGGSPGSTAGGIKTVTFGVILISTISIIRGNRDTEIFKKTINPEIISKSLAIVTAGMGLVIFMAFALTITEGKEFLDVLFESASAFATVGLSRGITPDLSDMGKVIIMLTMYAGRVGPLTMAFAIGYNKKHRRYKYSEGHISVG